MNLTLPQDFIYLAPSAGCVHEVCNNTLDVCLQSSTPRERGIPWSLSDPNWVEKLHLRTAVWSKVWMAQSWRCQVVLKKAGKCCSFAGNVEKDLSSFFHHPLMFLAAGAALIPWQLERGCGTPHLPRGLCPFQSLGIIALELRSRPVLPRGLAVTPSLWLCLGNACGQQERRCAAAHAFRAVSGVESEQ